MSINSDRVKKWRETHRDEYRAYQRAYKRRKRAQTAATKRVEAPKEDWIAKLPKVTHRPPPPGYDHMIDGPLHIWLLQHPEYASDYATGLPKGDPNDES